MPRQAEPSGLREIALGHNESEHVHVKPYHNDGPIRFYDLSGQPATAAAPANPPAQVSRPPQRTRGLHRRASRGRPVRLCGSRRSRTTTGSRAGPSSDDPSEEPPGPRSGRLDTPDQVKRWLADRRRVLGGLLARFA
jgi:hypothetical protein